MFIFSEMLALVQSESSFGAFVFHRRPAGLQATSDLVTGAIYIPVYFKLRQKAVMLLNPTTTIKKASWKILEIYRCGVA